MLQMMFFVGGEQADPSNSSEIEKLVTSTFRVSQNSFYFCVTFSMFHFPEFVHTCNVCTLAFLIFFRRGE